MPLIDFLGSPAAGWISGQDIQVDAGYIAAPAAGTPIQL